MDHERLWLISQDLEAKFSLSFEAVEAYLPSLKRHVDFLAASEPSVKVLVLLDGVSKELLTALEKYLQYYFPKAGPSQDHDVEADCQKWTKEFVSVLGFEMVKTMQNELAKRKLVAREITYLAETLADSRFLHWKFKRAKASVNP